MQQNTNDVNKDKRERNVILGGSWWFLMVLGDSLWFLVVLGGSKALAQLAV